MDTKSYLICDTIYLRISLIQSSEKSKVWWIKNELFTLRHLMVFWTNDMLVLQFKSVLSSIKQLIHNFLNEEQQNPENYRNKLEENFLLSKNIIEKHQSLFWFFQKVKRWTYYKTLFVVWKHGKSKHVSKNAGRNR